jgi:cell division protein ZapA (FtsZ GTPase activity inhibitor)
LGREESDEELWMGLEEKAGRTRSVPVTLAGAELTIKTDATDDYVSRLQRYVNDKVDALKPDRTAMAQRNALALAALSIADELFSAQEQRDTTTKALRDRLERLVTQIDSALGEGPDES